MQMLYLSARPEVLATTLDHVRANMNFVTEIVVVTPVEYAPAISALGVTVVTDDELVPAGLPADHAARNTLLRRRAIEGSWLENDFLLSDDDYRPLRSIDRTFFEENGRYRLYWFHDLLRWPNVATSFDHAIVNSGEILRQMGAPHLAYSAHMPQIVDRDLFLRVFDRVGPPADRYAVCEWSLYGNLAPTLAPGRFHDPVEYETLGWPENPASWLALATPARHSFENVYLEHYAPGGVFSDMDDATVNSSELALDKAIRWRNYCSEIEAGRRRADVGPAVEQSLFKAQTLGPARRIVGALFSEHDRRLAAIERRLSSDKG